METFLSSHREICLVGIGVCNESFIKKRRRRSFQVLVENKSHSTLSCISFHIQYNLQTASFNLIACLTKLLQFYTLHIHSLYTLQIVHYTRGRTSCVTALYLCVSMTVLVLPHLVSCLVLALFLCPVIHMPCFLYYLL